MKKQIKKGRPPKEKGAAKRDHFSVWVSSDQKSQINQMIEKSGLSASQFFLTLALDVPFKGPQKRTLPKVTAETIRIPEQYLVFNNITL
ncbi:plasmid mobilization protein [Dyadobacter endophyticus]|uniref:plasmid mobilization protein n=1 Tax=Dyadobacter endophyticus TaxID=1749036 RepID=UPI003CE6D501